MSSPWLCSHAETSPLAQLILHVTHLVTFPNCFLCVIIESLRELNFTLRIWIAMPVTEFLQSCWCAGGVPKLPLSSYRWETEAQRKEVAYTGTPPRRDDPPLEDGRS